MTYHCPDWVYDAAEPNGEDASYFYSLNRCTRFREPSEVIVDATGDVMERPEHDGGSILIAVCDTHEIDCEWNNDDPWREHIERKEWAICNCDQIYANSTYLDEHYEEEHEEYATHETTYAGGLSTHQSWYSYTNG